MYPLSATEGIKTPEDNFVSLVYLDLVLYLTIINSLEDRALQGSLQDRASKMDENLNFDCF